MKKSSPSINFIGLFHFLVWSLFIGTLIIFIIAPEPSIIEKNLLLNVDNISYSESRDRYIFIFWIILSLFLFWIILKNIKIKYINHFFNMLDNNFFFISLLFVILLVFNWSLASPYILENYPGVWQGLPIINIAIGVIFSIVIIMSAIYIKTFFFTINHFLIAISLFVFIPTLLQIPANIDDELHFNFLVDEFLYLSTNRTLFIDFFPTYTNLLGAITLPLVKIFQVNSLHIIIITLVSLQIICIFIIYKLLLSFHSPKFIGISFFIFLAPIFFVNNFNLSPKSALSVFPVRFILPVLLFLSVYVLINSNQSKFKLKYFLTGILAAFTLLNNLEFGATAVVAAIFLIIICKRMIIDFKISFLSFFLGLISPLILFFLFYALKNDVASIKNIYLFHKVSLSGYFAIPMTLFGIHSVIIPFFIFAFLFSVYFLLRDVSNSNLLRRKIFTIAFFSLWSLLSIPYFVGRSLPEHLFSGFAFPLGVICATLVSILLLYAKVIYIFQSNNYEDFTKSISLAVMILAISVSFMLGAQPPTYHLSKLKYISQQTLTFKLLKKDLKRIDKESSLLSREGPNKIAQILPLSQSIELELNVPSILVANHPTHVERIRLYTDQQCKYFNKVDYNFVLMYMSTFNILKANQICQQTLNMKTHETFSTENNDYTLVSLR